MPLFVLGSSDALGGSSAIQYNIAEYTMTHYNIPYLCLTCYYMLYYMLLYYKALYNTITHCSITQAARAGSSAAATYPPVAAGVTFDGFFLEPDLV